MTNEEFISYARKAEVNDNAVLKVTLTARYKGYKYLTVKNGRAAAANGNPHDLWFERRDGTCISRAYLGSANMKQNLEGWPERIATVEVFYISTLDELEELV